MPPDYTELLLMPVHIETCPFKTPNRHMLSKCDVFLQIKRMDMEARSLSADKSRALLNKVKEYKADLQSLREQLKQAAAGAGDGDALARAELGLGDNYYSTSAGQRERMLAATERIQKTSDRLQMGKQQLAETEVSTRWPCRCGFGLQELWCKHIDAAVFPAQIAALKWSLAGRRSNSCYNLSNFLQKGVSV